MRENSSGKGEGLYPLENKVTSLPYALGACEKRVGFVVREGCQQEAASSSLWKQERTDLINYGCTL